MHKRLSNKVVFISGGSGGIGRAIGEEFVNQGAKVISGDIITYEKDATDAGASEHIKSVILDVSDPQNWQDALKQAESFFGPLTTVINTAGISIPGTIEDIDLEMFHKILRVNLDGVFLGCKYGLEAIKAQKGASIINFSSTVAYQGEALFPAYSASKAGVSMLTKSVAKHCAEQKYDVRVNGIIPGAIMTGMVEGYIKDGIAVGLTRDDVIGGFSQYHPLGRIGTPLEIAHAAVYLASDEATFTTGTEIRVDGGFLT